MARSKLGRPPLPDGERKRTITVYLGTRTVEKIDQQAAQAGLSRNQVIASALAACFGDDSKGIARPPEMAGARGQQIRAARVAREERHVHESLGGA